jgi:energy-coupling factor transport system permease protein
MLSGVGLGTYRAGNSIAHRLDGRTKILALVGVTIAAFGATHIYYFAVIAAALFLASIVARLDLAILARSMILVLALLLISSLLTAIVIPGKPQAHIGPFVLSRDGVQLGIRIFFQFGLLIFASQVITLTTEPLAIATALQRLCSPLRRVGAPIDELAMLITLSLTFLPLIREQVRTVIDAQLARGVDLRRGPLETRLRGMLTLFNPIINANLRRADELATAMEARGYRVGHRRSHLREQRFGPLDYITLALTALLAIGAFYI